MCRSPGSLPRRATGGARGAGRLRAPRHVAEHTCVVALGITIDGIKIPLTSTEGATENATVTRDLLTGLRERAWRLPGQSWW
jgi:putative transposase